MPYFAFSIAFIECQRAYTVKSLFFFSLVFFVVAVDPLEDGMDDDALLHCTELY